MHSAPLLSGRDFINVRLNQKETVEELRILWKKLWQERLDDKLRAEGVATSLNGINGTFTTLAGMARKYNSSAITN
jgi:hypothetical protein